MSTEQAQAAKDEGNKFYKQKRFTEAIEQYDRAIALDGTQASFHLNKAAVYMELGNAKTAEADADEKKRLYEEAAKSCELALSVGNDNKAGFEAAAKAYLRLSTAQMKLGKFDEALTNCEKSMTEHRTDEAVKRQKEIQKAKAEKEELEYLDPQKGEEARLLGNQAFGRGEFVEAITLYSDAIRRNPNDVRLYSNRAACHQKLMNWSSALDDCDKAIELDPNFIKAYIRKGSVQTFLKQYPQAMKTLEIALKIDPNNQDAKASYTEVIQRIQRSQNSTAGDSQQVNEAMKDPEIRSILMDPVMQNILQEMQNNPASLKQHIQNPKVAEALSKLIAAGIVKLG